MILMRTRVKTLLFMAFCLLTVGCSTGSKSVINKAFEGKIPEIKRIGIVLSDVTVQEIAINKGKTLLKEETAKAVEVVERTAIAEVRALGVEAEILNSASLSGIFAPYNQVFPQTLYRKIIEKDGVPIIANFEAVANKYPGVEAFLLFRSCEKESSAGKKTLSAVGILVGVIPIRGERTFTDIALVDKTGRLLYYNNTYDGGSLRDEKNMSQTLSELLKNYREAKVAANNLKY
jgi:hypothetical protein